MATPSVFVESATDFGPDASAGRVRRLLGNYGALLVLLALLVVAAIVKPTVLRRRRTP